MKFIFFQLIVLSLVSFSAKALEPYQGADYDLESWMCGAPLVESLRKYDPANLLNDSAGRLKLKESLEKISDSNLNRLKDKLKTLTKEEQDLVDLVRTKFPAPSIHRTSVASAQIILTSKSGMVSATKRKQPPRGTPLIEQRLFSGHDCIFTAVGLPFGIDEYGTVILNFEDKRGFSWGSMYTGYRWALEVEKKDLMKEPEEGMKRRFAEQTFTNNHWDEALALLIIENVRYGKSFRGKGAPYNKSTILGELLGSRSRNAFWSRVKTHRLAFLEGHYTDNVPVKDIDYVQFRTADKPVVDTHSYPMSWFNGDRPFIQFFSREN